MQRIPRLTARFLDRRRALGADAGSTALAVRRTVADLVAGPLPGPGDLETLMPPVLRVWVRRVRGANFWVFYTFDEQVVSMVTLARTPPVPLEE